MGQSFALIVPQNEVHLCSPSRLLSGHSGIWRSDSSGSFRGCCWRNPRRTFSWRCQRGLDRLRMTSFIAEPSIPSREQPRKEAEKEAKGNLLLNPVFLIPLSIMLLLVLDMVLVVVLFVGLGVFFLAKSR